LEFEFLWRCSVGSCGVCLTVAVVWTARWCRQHGATALREASSGGHLPVVELLLRAGADPNAADEVCWNLKSRRALLLVDAVCV
jgi:hypothetical protein